MASIFGHIAASTALGYGFFPKETRRTTLLLAGCCAFVPDLDVLAFQFGIPYASQWGHRGWTHSVCFALGFGILVTLIYRYFNRSKQSVTVQTGVFMVLSTLSHPLLDMLTNGGRGCALWWPFSLERIFFPYRPIQVSPMGISVFFSQWGLEVIISECFWIGGPALLLVVLAKAIRGYEQAADA